MGEEYVRQVVVMGSVPSLGPVILHDDMEGVLKWVGSGTGADWAVAKSATTMYNGSASLQLKTRVTAPASGDLVKAVRTGYQRVGERYGLEVIWRPVGVGVVGEVFFCVEIHDGTYGHHVRVSHDHEGARWYYYNEAASHIEIPGSMQGLKGDCWHRLRFEFDQASGRHRSMVSDGMSVDMSSLSYYKLASGNANDLEVWLMHYAFGAAAAEVFMDEVLLLEL